MSAGGRIVVVTDTSVLVNFLCIDRMDLLARHSDRFVITDHVADEITDHYPEEKARLNAALADGTVEQCSVSGEVALDLFQTLSETRKLGSGESAAIAYAIANHCALAIEDRAAVKRALELKSDLVVLGTQDIMVQLIRSGFLDIADADRIKETWAEKHRFRLAISSFGEVL